jgi:hypothetical protein
MANVRDKVTVVRWLVSRNAAPVLAVTQTRSVTLRVDRHGANGAPLRQVSFSEDDCSRDP